MRHVTTPQPPRPLSALDVIFTRRSVRAYDRKTVDQQTIRLCSTRPCVRRRPCRPSHGCFW